MVVSPGFSSYCSASALVEEGVRYSHLWFKRICIHLFCVSCMKVRGQLAVSRFSPLILVWTQFATLGSKHFTHWATSPTWYLCFIVKETGSKIMITSWLDRWVLLWWDGCQFYFFLNLVSVTFSKDQRFRQCVQLVVSREVVFKGRLGGREKPRWREERDTPITFRFI